MQILCDTFGVCPVWAFLYGETYAAGPQTNFGEQGYKRTSIIQNTGILWLRCAKTDLGHTS